MDLLKTINAARERLDELAKIKDRFSVQLDKVVAKRAKADDAENQLRSQIKAVNQELFGIKASLKK